MFKNIVAFFKKIDDFLIAASDYIDLRVKTGKYIYDIQYLHNHTNEILRKRTRVAYFYIMHWTITQVVIAWIKQISQVIRRIPIIGDLCFLLVISVKYFFVYFFEVVLILVTGEVSFLLLAFLFQYNPTLFTIVLLPLMFINLSLATTLYSFIRKQELHESTPFFKELKSLMNNASSLMVLFSLHVFLIFAGIMAFLLFAFSLTILFDTLRISWENSFIFWVIVIPLLFIILVGLFIFSLTSYHAYFFMIFQRSKPIQALRQSWNYIKGSLLLQLLYSTVVFLCFYPLFVWAFDRYYAFGIALGVGLLGQSMMLLTYLLEKIFSTKETVQIISLRTTIPKFLTFSSIIGLLTFFMTSALVVQQHPNIQEFLWQKEQEALLDKGLTTYSNEQYRYLISYPEVWTIYHWEPNVTTLYNNYNGSQAGGIWVKIGVHPLYSPDYDFEKLYNSDPGLVSYNTGDQTIITKISTIDTETYTGVSYSYSVPEEPFPQFQQHYLIKKDNQLYDISFITRSKDIERRMNPLFERMFQSFRFFDDAQKQK